jgi:hypothetical protein
MSISRDDEQDEAEAREDALLAQLAECRKAIQFAARLIQESCDCHEQDRQAGQVECRCYPNDTVPECGWCQDVAAWRELPIVAEVRGQEER